MTSYTVTPTVGTLVGFHGDLSGDRYDGEVVDAWTLWGIVKVHVRPILHQTDNGQVRDCSRGTRWTQIVPLTELIAPSLTRAEDHPKRSQP